MWKIAEELLEPSKGLHSRLGLGPPGQRLDLEPANYRPRPWWCGTVGRLALASGASLKPRDMSRRPWQSHLRTHSECHTSAEN